MNKLFYAAAFLLFAICLEGADFTFARNGKTQYVIAIPEKPAGFDRQAADDLRHYLGKMTGADFRIVAESEVPAGKKAIYVGQTAYAGKAGVDLGQLTAEEWVIKNAGENLILSGGKPVGSFYAVWRVLNQLGCYCLTWDQDAVPDCKDLRADIADERKKPAFDGRMIWDSYGGYFLRNKPDPAIIDAYRMWKLRNGINGKQYNVDKIWCYGVFNIAHEPQFHSLSLYVNPALFEKHPEYFWMDEHGKRLKPLTSRSRGSLCMSNREMAKHALNSLRGMIRKHRAELPKEEWPSVYDISTLDATPFICKCPECLAIVKEDGSETGLLLYFINYIAEEIRKEYPDIFIRTFGYKVSAEVPNKILPADNVIIQLADKFTVSDPFRPLNDPLNADRVPYFKNWSAKAKRLGVWDYGNLGGSYYNPPRPDTIFNALQSDLRFFRDLKIKDIFLECGQNLFAPQSFIFLTYFTAAQLMLDPEKDVDRLAEIYCKYYYGPAGKEMLALFNGIRDGMKKQRLRQNSAMVAHWEYLTPDFMSETYIKMKRLAESLPEKSIYRRRVNAERVNFIWYAVAQREFYRAAFKAKNINIDDLVEECRTLAKAYIRRIPLKDYTKIDKTFEEKFKTAALNLPRPEKFKDVPNERFRMISYLDFRGQPRLGARVVNDPESITGKALRSANQNPAYHGVDRAMPNPKYRTTTFKWGNYRSKKHITLRLKKIHTDEKYHWYRFPGKLELDPVTYFWGQGWAIQAQTSRLYVLTDGSAEDNTWDEAWVSIKFTGPAYVPGSKKENAIYVDMAVLVKEPPEKRK